MDSIELRFILRFVLGKIAIVKNLIKMGADVNLPDVDGVTALDIAIGNDRQELAKLLM